MQVTDSFRNFALIIVNMTEKEKKDREKTSRETLGRFFYDLSKATFTTNVASCIFSVIRENLYTDSFAWIILLVGMISTAFLAYLGFITLKR